jgi:septal ring factor EnvC (AmiA/AmiB activator)
MNKLNKKQDSAMRQVVTELVRLQGIMSDSQAKIADVHEKIVTALDLQDATAEDLARYLAQVNMQVQAAISNIVSNSGSALYVLTNSAVTLMYEDSRK